MATDELIEVFATLDPLALAIVTDEVLGPAGVSFQVRNRVSTAFPAPDAMAGGFHVAVPAEVAEESVRLIKDAEDAGLFTETGSANDDGDDGEALADADGDSERDE